MRILRDPFFIFIITGAGIFGLYRLLAPAPPDPRTIVVDAPTMHAFIQSQSQSLTRDGAAAFWAAQSPQRRRDLAATYLREEALYREARALGLDSNDTVIRQRLVQKMERLVQGAADDMRAQDRAPAAAPSYAALQAFYEAHAGDYRAPATVTFAHVFISANAPPSGKYVAVNAGQKQTFQQARALALKEQMTADNAGFTNAPRYGDRFAFGVNHVEQDAAALESKFGAAFTADIFARTPNTDRWQGPVGSDHGLHLVMLVGKEEPRLPPLEEVKARVTQDYLYAKQQRRKAGAIKAIVSRYQVEMDLFAQP